MKIVHLYRHPQTAEEYKAYENDFMFTVCGFPKKEEEYSQEDYFDNISTVPSMVTCPDCEPAADKLAKTVRAALKGNLSNVVGNFPNALTYLRVCKLQHVSIDSMHHMHITTYCEEHYEECDPIDLSEELEVNCSECNSNWEYIEERIEAQHES